MDQRVCETWRTDSQGIVCIIFFPSDSRNEALLWHCLAELHGVTWCSGWDIWACTQPTSLHKLSKSLCHPFTLSFPIWEMKRLEQTVFPKAHSAEHLSQEIFYNKGVCNHTLVDSRAGKFPRTENDSTLLSLVFPQIMWPWKAFLKSLSDYLIDIVLLKLILECPHVDYM